MYLDALLFEQIHSLSGHSSLLDTIAIFCAQYLEYVWIAVLVVLLFWPKRQRLLNRSMILMGLLAGCLARFALKSGVVLIYPKPRPFLLEPIHPLISTPVTENLQSFPSGHMLFFFALATVIFYCHRRWGVLSFLLAAIMGVSRIYVGVHWPADIIFGALLGVVVGWLVCRYYVSFSNTIDQYVARGFKFIGR